MKKLCQKTLYVTLCFVLGLCLLTACGKDKDTQDDDRQAASSPTASKEPENTSESMEEDTDDDADSTDGEEENPDDEENKKEDKEKEDNTSPDDSSSIRTDTAKGYMNGFADSHTVEITLDNGDVVSYQVYDEDTLAKLEGYDTGSADDTFSFTYTEEDGYLTIISVE